MNIPSQQSPYPLRQMRPSSVLAVGEGPRNLSASTVLIETVLVKIVPAKKPLLKKATTEAAKRPTAVKSGWVKSRRAGWGALALAALLLLSACERSAVGTAEATILSFAASPKAVQVGDVLNLSWHTQGAVSCGLELLRSADDEVEGAGSGVSARAGERAWDLADCASGERRYQATAPGRYHAKLTVTDALGRRHASVVQGLEVEAAAAQAAFSATPGDDPLAFAFDASASAGALAYAWNFGDGTEARGARVSHRYAAAGRYTVTLSVTGAGGQVDTVAQVVTAEGTPQRERVVLLGGDDLSAWRRVRGGEADWPVQNGELEVRPGRGVGANSLRTANDFGDFRLHLEFWVPATPSGTPEQARGNSGVYLQGRYEVQILDSFGMDLRGADDAGAIYGVKNADENASRPAESWQSFDLTFRAARYEGDTKLEDARLSLVWNGVLVHDEVSIPNSTQLGNREGPSDGPIVLQDHGSRVRFRNIWLEPL